MKNKITFNFIYLNSFLFFIKIQKNLILLANITRKFIVTLMLKNIFFL